MIPLAVYQAQGAGVPPVRWVASYQPPSQVSVQADSGGVVGGGDVPGTAEGQPITQGATAPLQPGGAAASTTPPQLGAGG